MSQQFRQAGAIAVKSVLAGRSGITFEMIPCRSDVYGRHAIGSHVHPHICHALTCN
jgi:hypothetical protein